MYRRFQDMLNKKIMKSALIAFSCLMFAVPTNTYAAGSNANQTLPKSATTQTSNNNMSKLRMRLAESIMRKRIPSH